MAASLGSTSTANFLAAIPRAVAATRPMPPKQATAASISLSLFSSYFHQSGKSHKRQRQQSGGDQGDGSAAKGIRNRTQVDAFTQTGKQHHGQGITDAGADGKDQRFNKRVGILNVKYRNPENGTIGSDQGQKYA